MLAASAFAKGPDDRYAAIKRWMKRRFGLHFVPLAWLEEQLAAEGYVDTMWPLPSRWFGYTFAHKAE